MTKLEDNIKEIFAVLDGTNWYQLSVQKTFEELEAEGSGLTSSEAKARLYLYPASCSLVYLRKPVLGYLCLLKATSGSRAV